MILFQDDLKYLGATEEKWKKWMLGRPDNKTGLELYLKEECRAVKQAQRYTKYICLYTCNAHIVVSYFGVERRGFRNFWVLCT